MLYNVYALVNNTYKNINSIFCGSIKKIYIYIYSIDSIP